MKLLRPALSGLAVFACLRLAAAPVDSSITAVTVYTDRAVVTRTAAVELAGGTAELVFANLPEGLVDQSLQVSGRGTAQATILDVSARRTFVDFTPNARVKELEDQLRVLRTDDRRLADAVAVLGRQSDSINEFMRNAVAATKDAGRPKLDEVRSALEFGHQQLLELAQKTQDLDAQRAKIADQAAALEKQLNELRGAGGKGFKTVTVRLAAAQAGGLELTLSYTLDNARWMPAYDARVLSGERAVALGYFGVVRQNTGEDWKDVALTLSTARPSLGGAAPELGRWEVDLWRDEVVRLEQFEVTGSAARAKTTLPAPGSTAMQDRVADAQREQRAAAMAAAEIDAGATSASFKITTATTIPSDGSAQKVPITTARLAAKFDYATTPKLQPTAFLTTQVSNTTDFPLLAGALNVFLDGTFVATSGLKTVMPAEKFDLALGADEGIAVKHERRQRFVENTGLMNSGTRTTYEYRLTVQNNKATAERIAVSDQIPLSRHEKIVVKQLVPAERELKPDADGKLKWTLDLKPGEKRELTVKFTVEHPNDVKVTGLE